MKALAALLLACCVLAMPARAQEKVVNVYNWTDYIDPAVVEKFTAETGIRVQYDVYDSLETLEAKLLTGRSGYDIVVPTSEPTFSRLIRAKALAEIDRAKVPNWTNLDPALMARVGAAWADAQRSREPVVWLTHAGVVRAATLLARGITAVHHADQWPVQAPGFGQLVTLRLLPVALAGSATRAPG